MNRVASRFAEAAPKGRCCPCESAIHQRNNRFGKDVQGRPNVPVYAILIIPADLNMAAERGRQMSDYSNVHHIMYGVDVDDID